jgi:hypothetical protein
VEGANLDTGNTDANVRSLYHTDIIGTIANCEQDGLLSVLNEFNNERFLQRRYPACRNGLRLKTHTLRGGKTPTANDCLAHDCEFQKRLGQVLLQSKGKTLTI